MSGYWLVSERLKMAFTEIDPVAFEFVECDYVLPDGTEGPTYHLCEVARELDAVDEEASKFRVIVDEGYPGGKFYDLRGGASLAFKRDVIGDSHVFRSPYSGDLVYCDRMFRDAIRAAGMEANVKRAAFGSSMQATSRTGRRDKVWTPYGVRARGHNERGKRPECR